MVMEDPFGIRHMVPFVYYKNYHIEPGMEVVCRVDHVNCTGRIFLEPEHPFYIPGETGQFHVRSVALNENNESDLIGITVSDVFGNEIRCEIDLWNNGNIKPGDTIELRIQGVKKGRPILNIV